MSLLKQTLDEMEAQERLKPPPQVEGEVVIRLLSNGRMDTDGMDGWAEWQERHGVEVAISLSRRGETP